MPRYRPPRPRASPYITLQGHQRLQQEQKALWERRAGVTRALAAAAAEGDRSENAEYIYRKKELREIDRRIRYLQLRLPELKIVDTTPGDPDRIYFGARVTLEDETGRQVRYRIVGPDEADAGPDCISMDSPMARALHKKRLDDEVSVKTPGGEARYCILAVDYD
ncbi:MAG TPA: transcription elongation factor GreB [Chromatiales bacterium]|nr:transcription elongation factor GreB [Chromatiales bacterium]